MLGNDSQTIGPENVPREVHLILLEGIVLKDVDKGRYFLNVAPLILAAATERCAEHILIK